ncbi:MAG: hypothetical protein H6Q65_1019 [Firmicutes bacterium]|nr:hypothetical protein [Bacillota bacterium]
MLPGFFLRLLVCAILGILCMGFSVNVVTAETRTLSKDTKLYPQGWTVGDRIEFKDNTSVTLNELGEVVTGTLMSDTYLRPCGWDRVIGDYYHSTAYTTDIGLSFHRYYPPFIERAYNVVIPSYGHLNYKGGTPVTFNEKGYVISGTIEDKATIQVVKDRYGYVMFKAETVLVFYESGAILSGVLDADTSLRPTGWRKLMAAGDNAGFLKFSAKKPVQFQENGEVVSGTVKESVTLLSVDGTTTLFPAGSAVTFSDAGAFSASVN